MGIYAQWVTTALKDQILHYHAQQELINLLKCNPMRVPAFVVTQALIVFQWGKAQSLATVVQATSALVELLLVSQQVETLEISVLLDISVQSSLVHHSSVNLALTPTQLEVWTA